MQTVVDFGGEGPLVHLAHANGFPPGTYRPLARTLTDHYRVLALPARPLWPGSRPECFSTWHQLADDLIQALDDRGLTSILAVGHSMGGVATLWAAVARPELFRAVTLVDPVILPPGRLWVLRALRRLGDRWHHPLVRGALRRRRVWPSRLACYESYRDKPFFARWPDESLWAYVEAGTRDLDDGRVALAYPPAWEARIFETIPTDVWQAVPDLRVPTLILRGELSDTFLPASQARMARLLPHARFAVVPGAGHLAPMERPAVLGAMIRDFFDALE